jgi:hypothetical protein
MQPTTQGTGGQSAMQPLRISRAAPDETPGCGCFKVLEAHPREHSCHDVGGDMHSTVYSTHKAQVRASRPREIFAHRIHGVCKENPMTERASGVSHIRLSQQQTLQRNQTVGGWRLVTDRALRTPVRESQARTLVLSVPAGEMPRPTHSPLMSACSSWLHWGGPRAERAARRTPVLSAGGAPCLLDWTNGGRVSLERRGTWVRTCRPPRTPTARIRDTQLYAAKTIMTWEIKDPFALIMESFSLFSLHSCR